MPPAGASSPRRQRRLRGLRRSGLLTWVIRDAFTRREDSAEGFVELLQLAAHSTARCRSSARSGWVCAQRPHHKIEGELPSLARGLADLHGKRRVPRAIPKTPTHVLIRPERVRQQPAADAPSERGIIARYAGARRTKFDGSWAIIAREGQRLGYVPAEAFARPGVSGLCSEMRSELMHSTQLSVVILAALVAGLGLVGEANTQEPIKPFGRRVVGGEKTDIRQHPWQVALQFRGNFSCGGSIIGQGWVLTAAHCFKFSARGGDWRAKAGATNHATSGVWAEVERVIVHQNFNPVTYENDIALIKLKSPPAGRVIPLVDASAPLQVGQPLEVTGWGATEEDGAGSKDLQKATVPYVDTAVYNDPASYNGAVRQGMMCAGKKRVASMHARAIVAARWCGRPPMGRCWSAWCRLAMVVRASSSMGSTPA